MFRLRKRHIQVDFLSRSSHCPLAVCYGGRKGNSHVELTRKRFIVSKIINFVVVLTQLWYVMDDHTSERQPLVR